MLKMDVELMAVCLSVCVSLSSVAVLQTWFSPTPLPLERGVNN